MHPLIGMYMTQIEVTLQQMEKENHVMFEVQRAKYDFLFPDIFASDNIALHCLREQMIELENILDFPVVA